MELHEFLLARIAEDEAAIESRIAGELERLHRDGMPHWTRADLLTTRRDEAGVLQYDASWLTRPLAECDAKRRLLDGYDEAKHHYDEERDVDGSTKWNDGGAWAFLDKLEVWESVLKVITLPYADHPDYREEWRP